MQFTYVIMFATVACKLYLNIKGDSQFQLLPHCGLALPNHKNVQETSE